MVLSTILLCGAVPFQSPTPTTSVQLINSSATPIHIVCCRCHMIPHQHQILPSPPLPDVVADSLPQVQRRKIISSSSTDHHHHHHQQIESSTNKQQCSAEEEDQVDLQDSNIGAKTLNHQWRQVGRDLRIIADTFSSSISRSSNNQPPTASSSSTWTIWNVLLQGAVVYVGWKVHRWTSEWSAVFIKHQSPITTPFSPSLSPPCK